MKRVLLSWCSSLLACALSIAAAGAAHADEPRVAVGTVSGSISFMIESSIRSTLKRNGVDVVSATEVVAAKAKAGAEPEAWAAEVGAGAVIEADAVRQGTNWVTTVRVIGANGNVLKTWKVKGKEIKKLTAQIDKKMWKELGPTISRAKPAAGAKRVAKTPAKDPAAGKEPVTSAAPDDDEEDEDAAAPGGKKLTAISSSSGPEGPAKKESTTSPAADKTTASSADSGAKSSAAGNDELTPSSASSGKRHRNEAALEALIGFDFFARSFRYNDDLFGRLRPYTLSGAPSLSARVTFYPAALFTRGFAANIGLDAGIQYAFGIESSDSTGASYPTKAMELSGGLIGRIPIGDKSEATVSAGGGIQNFSVGSADAGADPDLPEVGYGFLRGGVGLRIQMIDELALRVGAGYRLVTGAGGIQEDAWFPRSGAGGLDGSVSIGYALLDSLEVLLGVSARHYFYTMNPEPGDRRIAGGAVDQYYGGTLSLAWTLR